MRFTFVCCVLCLFLVFFQLALNDCWFHGNFYPPVADARTALADAYTAMPDAHSPTADRHPA